jgi:DnaK suppressor protein
VLDDVDWALQRLSAGTYGSCENCGGCIPDADLALDPAGRLCHQHRAETSVDADDPTPVLEFEEFP